VLSLNWDMLRRGSSVVVGVVGAGLSWGGWKIHFRERA